MPGSVRVACASSGERSASHHVSGNFNVNECLRLVFHSSGNLSRETEVRRKVDPKDLRQQEDETKRDGQTSPARDRGAVVG